MGTILFFLLVLGGNFENFANAEAMVRSSCTAEKEGDLFLYTDDFTWDLEYSKLPVQWNKIYFSKKRLRHRAYYNAEIGTYFFPLSESYNVAVPIQLPRKFIDSVREHIEEALRLQYAELIAFTDMGHAHLLMPEEKFSTKYSLLLPQKTKEFLEGYLAESDLKILYHTAEQIKLGSRDAENNFILSEDKWLQWRYYSRNVVGANQPDQGLEVIYASKELFNTAIEYPGYHYGYGFSVSANQNGCFPFEWNGKTYFFDLSLDEITSNPASGDVNFRLKLENGHRSL